MGWLKDDEKTVPPSSIKTEAPSPDATVTRVAGIVQAKIVDEEFHSNAITTLNRAVKTTTDLSGSRIGGKTFEEIDPPVGITKVLQLL